MQTNIFFLALVGFLALASGSRIPLESSPRKLFPKHLPEAVVDTPEDNPIITDQSAPWDNLNVTRVPLHLSTKQVDLCDCGQQSSGRIVGGTQASPGEVPWRVAIRTKHWNSTINAEVGSICGGTIISPRWVLTAQHCFHGMDVRSIKVYAGEIERQNAKPIEAEVSPLPYNPETHEYDMALLRLNEELDFNNPRIRPACLPFGLEGKTEWAGKVLASGWGREHEGIGGTTSIMRKVVLDVIGNRQCQQFLGREYRLLSTQLCTLTDSADTCQGDSGGSIDAQINGRWHAVGVVSFGWGCARRNTPGIYTRVSEFLSAIEAGTGEKYCKK